MPPLDDAAMRRRVGEARVARLATIDASGRPHLVPVTFALDGDMLYSAVDQKPKGTRRLQRLKNIERDPRVTVLVDHYDDDWSQLSWVRIDGKARIVEAGEEFDRTLALLGDKYEQYREDAPDGPVIVIEAEDFTGWAAGG